MPKSSMGSFTSVYCYYETLDSFINSQLIVLCHIIGVKVALQWLSSDGGEGCRKEERGELMVVDEDEKEHKENAVDRVPDTIY